MKNNIIGLENNIIKEYGEGIPLIELVKKYKTSRITLIKLFNKNNICVRGLRKYNTDETFFEEINTPEQAYFLGLFYADGCVSKDITNSRINLQSDDKYILEKLSSIAFGNRPIHDYISKGENGKIYYTSTFDIRIKKIAENLNKQGCTPNKSFILKFPTQDQVPKEFMSHFIRGYFDGDGSINFKLSKWKEVLHKYPNISIIGSLDFCGGLYDFLRENFEIELRWEIRNKYSTPMLILNSIAKRTLVKFYNYIYKDCKDLFLKRKKKLFDEGIEILQLRRDCYRKN